jgi:hypothetical protein
LQNFGQIMPRECKDMLQSIDLIARNESTRRTILSLRAAMDGFAALEMTRRDLRGAEAMTHPGLSILQ